MFQRLFLFIIVIFLPVCKTIVGRLSSAVAQQNDVSVQLEALDILGDLLSRFGGLLLVFHPNILEALSPQLKSPRLAVRKRWLKKLKYCLFFRISTLTIQTKFLLLIKIQNFTIFLNQVRSHGLFAHLVKVIWFKTHFFRFQNNLMKGLKSGKILISIVFFILLLQEYYCSRPSCDELRPNIVHQANEFVAGGAVEIPSFWWFNPKHTNLHPGDS